MRKETQIINKLDVDAPQQINLRVRVAEISRSTVKELGVNWEVLAQTGNFVFALATGTPTVLVTHQVNITALTGVYPTSGEIVVIRLNGEAVDVVGRVAIP